MKLFVQIVWDLPRISKGVKSLEQSAVRFAYREVAPPVQAFGNLVAQCFETQAVIALVNCSLTTLGLYALKVSRALEDSVILLRFALLSPVFYLPDLATQIQVLLHSNFGYPIYPLSSRYLVLDSSACSPLWLPLFPLLVYSLRPCLHL
jgi:hypothetical protein